MPRKRLALLGTVLGLGVLVWATGSSFGSADADLAKLPNLKGHQVTFVGFGGDLQAAEDAAWLKPFAKLTGAKVLQDDPIDYAKVKAQVDSKNVTWNVIEADTFFVTANCGKLFEKLPAGTLRAKQFYPGFITNQCGVPVVGIDELLVYDKAKFGSNPPRSWADFFDTKKYPGKRCMWNFVQNGALEAALMASGVSPKKLYPLDLDRAFRQLDKIKDDIVWAQSPGQTSQMMQSNSAAMCLTFNGRAYAAIKNGAKWGAVWKQNIRSWDNLAIVKGTKDKAAAIELMKYIASPKAQAALTERIVYSPTTPASKPKVSPLVRAWLHTTPAHFKAGVSLDQRYWARNFDTLNQRWTDWQTG